MSRVLNLGGDGQICSKTHQLDSGGIKAAQERGQHSFLGRMRQGEVD
jgi:hypothetical protein